jgi:uncharacterized protein (TIRG00374 family)
LKKSIIITVVISVAIIMILIWISNPSELLESLKRTNLNYILLVLVLYIINLLTKSYRWYLLVNSSGTQVSFRKTVPFYLIGLALNNITPGKIGGEPVRAYLLNKEAKVSIGQGIASIFTEKILDIIVITSMAVIGAIFIISLLTPEAGRILILILIGVVAAIIATLVIVSHSTLLKKTVDKSVNFAKKVSDSSFTEKLSQALVGFVDKYRLGMKEILKAKRTASACIVLTVIIWINEALRLFIILLALPDVNHAGIGAVFIASSIANILALALPFGAGHILGIETVLIALGLDPVYAGAASILHVATSLWISVPLGAAAMVITGFKFSKIGRATNGLTSKSSISNPQEKKENLPHERNEKNTAPPK